MINIHIHSKLVDELIPGDVIQHPYSGFIIRVTRIRPDTMLRDVLLGFKHNGNNYIMRLASGVKVKALIPMQIEC